jgi:orotate phosphoribosyltransferase
MRETIAKHLLEIGAVTLSPNDPYTWSSGMKSPIYCDNRLTLSHPTVRKEIADGLTSMIKENYPDVDIIAGTATAGIPHAAFISDRLDLPMVYVRSKAKGHGKAKQIEGQVKDGQKAVVVEDLISTGGSVINAVEALRNENIEVIGVVAIFTYELEKGKEMLQNAAVKVQTLTDFSTLLNVAKNQGMIKEVEVERLKQWSTNPDDTSWLIVHQ